MKKRLLLVLLGLLFSLGLTVAADRVLGALATGRSHAPGLVFPANVVYGFYAPEFSYTAATNSLGFRDREFAGRNTAKIRILTLGDSFTYGWGVEASQSWPKVLETILRDRGDDVEIANLGWPGASPRNYAVVAERATRVLQPDWLIVGVLQGDDLAQLALPPEPDTGGSRDETPPDSRWRQAATWLYPNFLWLVNELSSPEAALTAQWTHEAHALLTRLTPPERARFERLDAEVKQVFLTGGLNPSMIDLSMRRPEYYQYTLDPGSASAAPLILEMAKQLARIKNAAGQHHARVLVVSVPYGIYVSAHAFRSRQRLGFSVSPDMLTTDAADEAIRRASRLAGIPFHHVTREFRQASLQRDFFFELDGHFNPAGHQYFAETLAPLIHNAMRAK